MYRALCAIVAVAGPLAAQVSPPAQVHAALQYTHLVLRHDDGTTQGAGGNGLSLRVATRPFAVAPRLAAELALTFTPEENDLLERAPGVRAVNLGGMYSLAPLGSKPPVNPFLSVAVGIMAYDARPEDPNACRPEDGCIDESPDLSGTKPTLTLGTGAWFALVGGLAMRADFRLHNRLGTSSANGEPSWRRELSAGLGYHF